MAQDFGDDMGERLFRLIGRAAGYAIRDWLREQEHARQRAGRDADAASGKKVAGADAPTQPETVCIPFGADEDAALFAKVCQDEGIQVGALADREGNGFVRFRTGDIERVQGCTDRFVEAMARMSAERVAQSLESAIPVTEERMAGLREIEKLPDLPAAGEREVDVTLMDAQIQWRDAPGETLERTFAEEDTEGLDIDGDVFFSGYTHDELSAMVGRDTGEDFIVLSVGEPYRTVAHEARTVGEPNRTQDIAEKVMAAREACRDFDDFKVILGEQGIGVTTTKDGENMFYEARRDEHGDLRPFGRDEAGNRDWAVGAKKLRENWEVDATHDWFERNTPKSPGGHGPMTERKSRSAEFERTTVEPQVADGSLDTDGRTPDLNQGIESHDGMDTDTRTLRLEREQNGTDVAPSKVREEQAQARGDDRSLSAVSEQCRASSKQLEAERGVTDRDIDISDKLNPVR